MNETIKSHLRSLIFEIRKDKIFEAAAALAFHTIFALAPIFIIFISAGSLIVGPEEIYLRFVTFFQNRFGEDVALFFSSILENKESVSADIFFVSTGLFVIIYASSNLFNHILESFFRIFGVRFREKNKIKTGFKKRVFSFLYMVAVFIIFFSVVLGNIAISVFASIYEVFGLPGHQVLFILLNQSFGVLVVFVLFSLTYKALSANSISWKDSFLGSMMATVLFLILNLVMSFYISASFEVALYGALGFFVAFLIWVYYSFLFILIGAEVSKLSNREKARM